MTEIREMRAEHARTLEPDATMMLDGIEDQFFQAAYVADGVWNGWACPYFTRSQVQDVIDACSTLAEDGGPLLRWNGDTIQVRYEQHDADEPEWPDGEGPVKIDGVETWSPGGYSWCWWVLR